MVCPPGLLHRHEVLVTNLAEGSWNRDALHWGCTSAWHWLQLTSGPCRGCVHTLHELVWAHNPWQGCYGCTACRREVRRDSLPLQPHTCVRLALRSASTRVLVPGRHYGDRIPRAIWEWPVDFDDLIDYYDRAS